MDAIPIGPLLCLAIALIPTWLFFYEAGLRSEREIRLGKRYRRTLDRLRRHVARMRKAKATEESEEAVTILAGKGG